MPQFIKEIEKYCNSDKKEFDFLDLIKKSKESNFPVYSLLLLIRLSETKEKEISSLEGWINDDYNNQLAYLKKEKQSFEAEKNKHFSSIENVKKKKLYRVLILSISLIAVISMVVLKFILPELRADKENEFWYEVLNQNSVESFEAYLYAYPNGTFKGKAIINKNKAQEDRNSEIWEQLTTIGTKEGYLDFLNLKLKVDSYNNEAKKRVDEINWSEALAENSVKGYSNYLAIYNRYDGKYYDEAIKKRSELTKLIDNIPSVESKPLKSYYEVFGTYKDHKDPYLNLRSHPINGAKILKKLKDGTKLEVLKFGYGKNNLWVKVYYPIDNTTGYVHSKYIIKIK